MLPLQHSVTVDRKLLPVHISNINVAFLLILLTIPKENIQASNHFQFPPDHSFKN